MKIAIRNRKVTDRILRNMVNSIENELVEVPVKEIVFPVGTNGFTVDRSLKELKAFKNTMIKNDGFTDTKILNTIDSIYKEVENYYNEMR